MSLYKYNPITPSLRQLCLIDKFHIWKGTPVHALSVGKKANSGRNHHGHITVRHKGGGHKRSFRKLSFLTNTEEISIVTRVEYDPNRSAFIALLHSQQQKLAYILAPRGLKVGDALRPGNTMDIKVGNVLSLQAIPTGSMIHNVEMFPGKGAQLVRSAGCFGQLVTKLDKFAIIKLPSGERRYFLNKCKASLGSVSKSDWNETVRGKAGRSRWLGVRPSVRGVAMNPIDHPHGGGEGKTAAGRHPVTPWGQLTKGLKTRKVRKSSKFIFKRRFER
jgi:large subunit ribosomal protein L2